MTRILIIEDEEPAVKRLWKMIQEIEPATELAGVTGTVTATKNWMTNNNPPDLIISDIQLSDGTSFDAFKFVPPSCPVIFVTAYDQYAIEAFKVNGFDYILKPVKKDELSAAFGRFKKLSSIKPGLDVMKLLESISTPKPEYKNRFAVRYGEHIKTISTDDVAYIFTEDKMNFINCFEGRRYPIDMNLDQLDKLLSPKQFFRINRQYIISIRSISEMFTYTKGRVLIKLNPPAKHETVVSTERSAQFKAWLDDAG